MKRVLVISPHPDDESIGCGGSLRRHVVDGDQVSVVFLTSGEKGGHGRTESVTIAVREDEARRAADILGVTSIEFWREPDGRVDVSEQLIQRLNDALMRWRPDVLYAPHEQESHADHRAAAALVAAAVGQCGDASPDVLMYEVWTPLQRIDHIADITPYINVKTSAIRAYQSQCEVLAFDDAFLGLARYRGEMHCWPEGEYAEAFARPVR